MATIRIKKNPIHLTRMVRDPETGKKLEPRVVYTIADSPFWRRRLQSGDVVLVKEDGGQEDVAGADEGNKNKGEKTDLIATQAGAQKNDQAGNAGANAGSATTDQDAASSEKNTDDPGDKKTDGEDDSAKKAQAAAQKEGAKKQPAKTTSKKK